MPLDEGLFPLSVGTTWHGYPFSHLNEAWALPFRFLSIPSPLLHLLQFFPLSQSVSPSEDREVLNYHWELPRKRWWQKSAPLPTSNTPRLQPAHQTHLPENQQERRITHIAPNPLFLSAGSRVSFNAFLSAFQKSTNWHDSEAALLVPPLDQSVLIYLFFSEEVWIFRMRVLKYNQEFTVLQFWVSTNIRLLRIKEKRRLGH